MKHILVLQAAHSNNIEIFESNFERQVGDVLTINNVKKTVKLILPNQEAKLQFIQAWNKQVGKINYQHQKQAKAQEAAFWAQLYNNNPIIRECLDTLTMSKAMGE